jgi:hypothetical protein
MELPMSGPEPDSTVPTAVVTAEWDTVTCRYVLAYGRMRTPMELHPES